MTIQTLEDYLNELLKGIEHPIEDKEKVLKLGDYPYWEDHELAHALYALHCQRVDIPYPPLAFQPLPSGAVPLYTKAKLPWGSLPYPKEHALLGKVLFLLGEKERAKKIAGWQSMVYDHLEKPIYSFLQQEKNCGYETLVNACASLFECVPYCPQTQFYDLDLGIATYRESHYSVAILGSGCKSGLGTYLFEDVGIINYGPHFFPLGEGDRFGIAGRCVEPDFQKKDDGGFSFSFQNRASFPHPRQPPLKNLEDSGFSGLWIKAKIEFQSSMLNIEIDYEGLKEFTEFAFVFFGKGKYCSVKKTHRLYPKSLDRYQGPSQEVTFYGSHSMLQIEAPQGSSVMEIIPLSGENHFWGADFLVAYLPISKQTFSIKINS